MSSPAAPAPTPPRPTRLIVADDSADMRLMLRMALEGRTDVELVAEACDGREAINLVAALRPDLLVLDVEMPVLDGISALPRLRSSSPDTRVVMLSAVSSPEDHAAAYSAGAAAYIQKGTPVTTLVDDLLQAADLLDTLIGTLSPASSLGVARNLASPSQARRFVADTLAGWGESDLTNTIQLLVTELVTNVIVHTSAAPEVSVRLFADHVHVEVTDADPSPPAPRDAEDSATSGRGLAFVDAMSVAWGWTPANRGKVVWFDIAR